ncbi:unnamed protein product [Tenebrio molitor]|nr:unnamed protein product [Tenebrio molitor]
MTKKNHFVNRKFNEILDDSSRKKLFDICNHFLRLFKYLLNAKFTTGSPSVFLKSFPSSFLFIFFKYAYNIWLTHNSMKYECSPLCCKHNIEQTSA